MMSQYEQEEVIIYILFQDAGCLGSLLITQSKRGIVMRTISGKITNVVKGLKLMFLGLVLARTLSVLREWRGWTKLEE